MSVECRTQHGNRRLQDGGVGIDECRIISIEGDAMVGRFGGKSDRSRGNLSAWLQLNPVVMKVIWVFFRDGTIERRGGMPHVSTVASIGREDDVTTSFIVNLGLLNIAHPELPLRELCQAVFLPVIEIEMSIAVAVAFPKDETGIKVLTQVATIGNVLVIMFFDKATHLALQVHLKHTIGLVPAFVKLKS